MSAIQRSKSYLLPEAQKQLSDLWDPDTAFALAALLLVWGGFQLFTPIGWVADIALAIIGALAFARDLYSLGSAVADAVSAGTDEAIEEAAKKIAAGLTKIGIDVVAGLLANRIFRGLRDELKAYRARYTGKPAANPGNTGRIGGTGAGVTVVQPETRKAGSEIRQFLNLSIPIVGGGLLLLGSAYLLRARRR